MDIIKGLKFFQVFLIILVSLISLSILPSKGYGDDWVYVGSYPDSTRYYKSSSVKIDKQNKIIKVWVKVVYTKKGKIDYLNEIDSFDKQYGTSDKQKYIDINHTLILYLLNYKEWKYSTTNITNYSKSGDVIYSMERPTQWKDITPDSTGEFFFNKILEDYNIQR